MRNDNTLTDFEQLLKQDPTVNDLFYEVIKESSETKRRKLLNSLMTEVLEYINGNR